MPRPLPGQPPVYSSAMDVVRKVVASEGIYGLYAGIQAPLPFVALFNATLFTSNGICRRVIGGGRNDDALSLGEIALAGVGAGAAVSFVACPTELVKCRLQVQPGVYNGAIDCARRVWQAGGIRSLFRGMEATLVREMPGTAIYFGAYEWLIRRFTEDGRRRNEVNMHEFVLAGGVAGSGKFYRICGVRSRRDLRRFLAY